MTEFSMIIIPDTQTMTKLRPAMFKTMTQWIAEHAEELNLKMVLHLGDVVNDGAMDEEQFKTASEAFETMHTAQIPLLIAPGNHDYDNMLDRNRNLTLFNRYFGVHRYQDRPWFGGTFEPGQAENCYATLDIEGEKLLFLALEFGPRDEVLHWADSVLAKHRDHKAIVATHSYMHMFGERTGPGDSYNPKGYTGAVGANDGEDVWRKSFKRHANLIAVFSGHQIPENVSYRTDIGENGNCVFQSFQNWQCADNGGEGRFRILTYRPSEKSFRLRVLNPLTGRYETEDGYELDVQLMIDGAGQGLKYP